MSVKKTSILLFTVIAGCATSGHQHEHGPAGQESFVEAATTCAASAVRYPVAGPHNNGWDSQWFNFACISTASSRFNSDYIAGQHLGNDIFGERGTPLQAVVDGWVPNNFSDPTGGNVVYLVDDCGFTHYYAHLDTVSVTGNQRVTAGTILGTLGNTGNAAGTAPHLHYSIYPDGVYSRGIDPATVIEAVESTACNASPPPGGGDPGTCGADIPPQTPPGSDPGNTVPDQATGLVPDNWVNVGNTSANLTWNPAARATSYDVTFLYATGDGWTEYYTWNTANPSFTAWPVYHDTHYAWTVKAKNSAGQATQSDWAYFYLD